MVVSREIDPPFKYQGQLLFNGLYTTDVTTPDDDSNSEQIQDKITDLLPDLSAIDDSSPRSGFEEVNLAAYLEEYDFNAEDARLHKPNHVDLADNLLDIKHAEEEFTGKTKVVTADSQRVSGQKVTEHTAYVYWDLPGLLMIHGAKPDRQRAMSALYEALGIANENESSFVNIEPVEFDPYFFLWLIHRFDNGKDISPTVSMLNISDIRIQGEERDYFGKSAQVSGSTDILRSTPFIAGLLKGKLPRGLEAMFDVNGQTVVADISASGRIHIKSEEDIRRSTDLERTLIGLQFVRNLTSLQQEWEYYDPDAKFVPPSFAETLYERGKKQDVSLDFKKHLVKDLITKRNESQSDWDHLEFS